MTNVIIVGHGGFGTAVQNSLKMLLGDTPGMFYVDFTLSDNLETLKEKLCAALEKCGENDVLFACDLTGGSPFRQAAELCVHHPNRCAVAGLNLAAFAEMVYHLAMPVQALQELAVFTTQNSVMTFP